jgi:hypothetical protein
VKRSTLLSFDTDVVQWRGIRIKCRNSKDHQHRLFLFSAQSPENPYSLQGGYGTVGSVPTAGGGAPGPPHHHPGASGATQGPYRYINNVPYFKDVYCILGGNILQWNPTFTFP